MMTYPHLFFHSASISILFQLLHAIFKKLFSFVWLLTKKNLNVIKIKRKKNHSLIEMTVWRKTLKKKTNEQKQWAYSLNTIHHISTHENHTFYHIFRSQLADDRVFCIFCFSLFLNERGSCRKKSGTEYLMTMQQKILIIRTQRTPMISIAVKAIQFGC